MMALAPGVIAQGIIVVTAIPGGGWIQSPDNTAGGTAQIVEGPPGRRILGLGSLELTWQRTRTLPAWRTRSYQLGIPFDDLIGGAGEHS